MKECHFPQPTRKQILSTCDGRWRQDLESQEPIGEKVGSLGME